MNTWLIIVVGVLFLVAEMILFVKNPQKSLSSKLVIHPLF